MANYRFKDVYLVSGKRTPFGVFGGGLKAFSATDLGVHASTAALEQAGVRPTDVDHVVFGNVVQTSADAIYCARHIGLKVGIPMEVPALTVNRLCGSGFEALSQAGLWIDSGVAKMVLAGGTESMSQAPYVVREARWGARLGHVNFEDMLTGALKDSFAGIEMAVTAENLGEMYGLTREDVDKYALLSQTRTAEATKRGFFKNEVAPVSWEDKKKGTQTFSADEHPRPQTTLEALAKLSSLFKKNGFVTAGTASGMVDGAAALVVASGAEVKAKNLKPLGRLVSMGVSGCDPKIMGIGPVPAAREALKAAGKSMEEMDRIEINEAFAAQVMAVEKELKIHREVFNVNGGAIAIGHPLGASGARLTMTLLYELRQQKKKFGLAGACIGGGQGMCLVVESLV